MSEEKLKWHPPSECLAPWRTQAGFAFPRLYKSSELWTSWLTDPIGMHETVIKFWNLCCATLEPPEDYDQREYMIDRFILQSEDLIKEKLDYFEHIGIDISLYTSSEIFKLLYLNREYVLRMRVRVKYRQDVYEEVRGEVATQERDLEQFWCKDQMKKDRDEYLRKHPGAVHGKHKPISDEVKKAVGELVENYKKEEYLPITFVKAKYWRELQKQNNKSDKFYVCCLTEMILSHIPFKNQGMKMETLRRTGSVKTGDITSLGSCMSPCLISIKESQTIAEGNKWVNKNKDNSMHNLHTQLNNLVCILARMLVTVFVFVFGSIVCVVV